MADTITGSIWRLDTTDGLVSDKPVIIDNIRITWNTASVGTCVIATRDSADVILTARTGAIASGNIGFLTQIFPMGNKTYHGLRKITTAGITTIEVITGLGTG